MPGMADSSTNVSISCKTCGCELSHDGGRSAAACAPDPRDAVCPACRAKYTDFGLMVSALAVSSGSSLRKIKAGLTRQGWAASLSTLSAYTSGKSQPVATATGFDRVRDLERYFEVPCGLLLRLWRGDASASPSPPARSDADGRLQPARQHVHQGGRSAAANSDLHRRKELMELQIKRFGGGLSRGGLIVIEANERFTVDANGFPVRSDIALTVCAKRAGISSYWYMHSRARNEYRTYILPTEGCGVGTTLTEESYRLSEAVEDEIIDVAELLLPRTLVPYRPCRLRFQVNRTYRPGAERPAKGVLRRKVTGANCDVLTLGIEFQGDAPRNLRRSYWPDRRYGHAQPRGEATPPRDEMVIDKPAPGCYGWEWECDANRRTATPT